MFVKKDSVFFTNNDGILKVMSNYTALKNEIFAIYLNHRFRLVWTVKSR